MKEKKEFLDWFYNRDFKGFEVDFGNIGVLSDAQKLVDDHAEKLENHWGEPDYRGFAKRLMIVKNAYIKNNEKKV